MSLIVNQPEAQLETKVFTFSSHFAYSTSRTDYKIDDVVIFDPEKEEEIIRGTMNDMLEKADVEIYSIGSTKDIVKRRKFNLGKEEMFVYDSERQSVISSEQNMVDLYIPITFFETYSVGNYITSFTSSDVVTVTFFKLFYKDEDTTRCLGVIEEKEFHKIKHWFKQDLKKIYEEKQKLIEQEYNECIQLFDTNADIEEFVDASDEIEEKITELQRKQRRMFNHIEFIG